MNRKQKKELRQRQSTRQLMGIVRVTPYGIVTDSGERVFFLIQPDNLSVLSPEVIRGRVRSLTMLLSTQPTLEILALDSRESFQRNKEYYLRRLEEETEPAVRELLERDMARKDDLPEVPMAKRPQICAGHSPDGKDERGGNHAAAVGESHLRPRAPCASGGGTGCEAPAGDLLPAGSHHGGIL